MEVLREENSKLSYWILIMLFGLWLLFFPLQGAVYQATIYLLPLTCLLLEECRAVLKTFLSVYRHLIVLLLLPGVVSFGRYLLAGHGEGCFFADFETLFRYLWRFLFFALVAASTVKVLNISSRQLLSGLVSSAALHCLWALVSSRADIVLFFEGQTDLRLMGALDSPNEFGLLMALGAVATLRLLMDKQKKITAVFQTILLAGCLIAMFLSQSRGAWLALAVGLGLFALCLYRDNVKMSGWAWGMTIGFLLITLWLLGQNDYLRERLELFCSDPARMMIWKHFMSVWRQHFWWGVYSLDGMGVGNASGICLYKNPHSIFLDVAVRTGVLGLSVLVFFWGFCLKTFWRSSQRLIVLPVAGMVLCGGLFSWSLYAKTFTQSLYALVLIFLFSDRAMSVSQPPAQREE